jgi:hypothetical protein
MSHSSPTWHLSSCLTQSRFVESQCQGFSVRKPTLVANSCAQTLNSFPNVAMSVGLEFSVSCPAGMDSQLFHLILESVCITDLNHRDLSFLFAGCSLVSAAVYGVALPSSSCLSTKSLGAYASPSSVCRAAMHAGVVTNEGGEFNAVIAAPPGSSTPCASVSNGMINIFLLIMSTRDKSVALNFIFDHASFVFLQAFKAPQRRPRSRPLTGSNLHRPCLSPRAPTRR